MTYTESSTDRVKVKIKATDGLKNVLFLIRLNAKKMVTVKLQKSLNMASLSLKR